MLHFVLMSGKKCIYLYAFKFKFPNILDISNTNCPAHANIIVSDLCHSAD